MVLDFPEFDGENVDALLVIKEPGNCAGLRFQIRHSAMLRGRANWFQTGCFACNDNMTF